VNDDDDGLHESTRLRLPAKDAECSGGAYRKSMGLYTIPTKIEIPTSQKEGQMQLSVSLMTKKMNIHK
jgi:hypothetical protein